LGSGRSVTFLTSWSVSSGMTISPAIVE
jgi:hypothetical protein